MNLINYMYSNDAYTLIFKSLASKLPLKKVSADEISTRQNVEGQYVTVQNTLGSRSMSNILSV